MKQKKIELIRVNLFTRKYFTDIINKIINCIVLYRYITFACSIISTLNVYEMVVHFNTLHIQARSF